MDKRAVRGKGRNLRIKASGRSKRNRKGSTKTIWVERTYRRSKQHQRIHEFCLYWNPALRTRTYSIGTEDGEHSATPAKGCKVNHGPASYTTVYEASRLTKTNLRRIVHAARQANLRPILIAKVGLSTKYKFTVRTEHALFFAVDKEGTLQVWGAALFSRNVAIKEAPLNCIEVAAFYHTWKYRVETIMKGCHPGDYPVVEVRGMFLRQHKIIYEENY